MPNNQPLTNSFSISEDTYLSRYGMTVAELRNKIKYKIALVTLNGQPVTQMSMNPYDPYGWDDDDDEALPVTNSNNEEIIEENEQTDTEEWDVSLNSNPLFTQPKDWTGYFSLDQDDVSGAPSEWMDEETGKIYTPSWSKQPPVTEPACEHKKTRNVELIFTVATECVDCGKRLK